jgi:hypothetical protein
MIEMQSDITPPFFGAPEICVEFDPDAYAVGLVMLPRRAPREYFKYAVLRSAGWTDEQLIEAQYVRRFFHPLERHSVDARYPEKFWRWLRNNPHVWQEFVKWARESKKSGRKRYSASAIIHRMRWDSEVTSATRFKMSDGVTPYLSRLLMVEYPAEFKGYFSTHERGAHIATELDTGEETEASEALAESEGHL